MIIVILKQNYSPKLHFFSKTEVYQYYSILVLGKAILSAFLLS
jgi:hypothetical protein